MAGFFSCLKGAEMEVGTKVKIPDIGPLATVVQSGRNMVKVALDGEQFWIERRLLEEIRQEVEK